MSKLKGLKTYAIAALLAVAAYLGGASPDDTVAVVQANAPEAAAVLAAGVALGRAIVALFGKLRTEGVIS